MRLQHRSTTFLAVSTECSALYLRQVIAQKPWTKQILGSISLMTINNLLRQELYESLPSKILKITLQSMFINMPFVQYSSATDNDLVLFHLTITFA